MKQMPKPIRVALAALLALFVLSPAAQAGVGVSDTASYGYKVTEIDYSAKADLAGGIFPHADECDAGVDAAFEGHVETVPSELSDLLHGRGSVTIHPHGTSGTVEAHLMVDSTLSDSWHRLDADCMGAETQTPCTQTLQSQMGLRLHISGGVGDRVKLYWSFSQSGDQPAELVPNSFDCVEPMTFPGPDDGSCNTFSGLSRFTAKKIKLPFICHAQRSTPPNNGAAWTIYAATASAKGALYLKRTWQR
ncbi:MAG: hypothetical protein ACOYD4_14410 [Solirubrobacterales bacterium]